MDSDQIKWVLGRQSVDEGLLDSLKSARCANLKEVSSDNAMELLGSSILEIQIYEMDTCCCGLPAPCDPGAR
jgi:hypothetical protein